MLKSLFIQNYALIRHLEINFRSGLSIISGETGAGKSILLGALSLIVGQRADTGVLMDKSKKCVVEVGFQLEENELKHFFTENDLDFEVNTIIRREISSSGKSRAFINDTPVNLPVLRELGLRLVDIHSQHQNLLLGDTLFQLKVVDDFARHSRILSDYKTKYEIYRRLDVKYKTLVDEAEKSKADLDYFQFQFDQLEKARLKEDEQQSLEEELETLTHAEEIKTNLNHASFILSDDENALLLKVKEVSSLLKKIIPFYPGAGELERRLESSHIELKDIASEIESLGIGIEHNPQRIEEISERLDLIYTLQQKHRVDNIPELIKIKDDLQVRLDEITTYDQQIESVYIELEGIRSDLNALAESLSGNRKKIIPELEKKVTRLVHQLGIPNGNFAVHCSGTEEFTSFGRDKIEFLFSANKRSKLQDIASVASGGEVSRLMLSIKSLITRSAALPTVIFDEIDAGVSGDIADKVGNIMNQMADHMQVINITHLPQIACKGKYHYLVYKEDKEDSTYTFIKLLNRDERIVEIAKLLSGE
ncbi:MAG: DNA repair protein RecN, partial [Bacteroidales bacterium]